MCVCVYVYHHRRASKHYYYAQKFFVLKYVYLTNACKRKRNTDTRRKLAIAHTAEAAPTTRKKLRARARAFCRSTHHITAAAVAASAAAKMYTKIWVMLQFKRIFM